MKIHIMRILALLMIIFAILLAACGEERNEMKRQAEKAVGDVEQEVKEEVGEAFLLGKIRAWLAAAGYGDLAVEVEQGVVTLKGEAPNEKDRIAVEAIVEKMEGVKRVNNQVTVPGKSLTPTSRQ